MVIIFPFISGSISVLTDFIRPQRIHSSSTTAHASNNRIWSRFPHSACFQQPYLEQIPPQRMLPTTVFGADSPTAHASNNRIWSRCWPAAQDCILLIKTTTHYCRFTTFYFFNLLPTLNHRSITAILQRRQSSCYFFIHLDISSGSVELPFYFFLPPYRNEGYNLSICPQISPFFCHPTTCASKHQIRNRLVPRGARFQARVNTSTHEGPNFVYHGLSAGGTFSARVNVALVLVHNCLRT